MNNELLKQRESALEKARKIYPLADEGDYPDNPNVNRLNRACVGAYMAGYDHSSRQREEDRKRIEELKRLLTATVYIIETMKSGKMPVDIDEGIAYYKEQALNP